MKPNTGCWQVALGGALISGAGIGLFGNCVGAFIAPVATALGVSRGAFSLYNTLSLLLCALTLPLYGWLLQRFPIRRVMAVCGLGCCLAPVLYAASDSLWQFYLGGALNGLFINGITMMAVSTLLSQWFSHRLSLAVGIAYGGMGVIAAAMLPVIRFVIAHLGWRFGYLTLSAVGAAIIFPSIWFLVREKPMAAQEQKQLSARDSYPLLLRSKPFWLAASALFIGNFINLAIYNNALSYLTDLNVTDWVASAVISAALLMMLATKPAMGALLDAVGIRLGGFLLALLLGCCGLVALLLPLGRGWLVAFALLLAACATVNAIPASRCAKELFGALDYPTVLALLTMACYLGSAAGTPIAALIFDLTGQYRLAWGGCIALSPLVALLFLRASTKK